MTPDAFRALPLDSYRVLVHLDEPLPDPPADPNRPGDARAVLDALAAEPWARHVEPTRPYDDSYSYSDEQSHTRAALARMLTLRPPIPLDPAIGALLDRILATETRTRPRVEPTGLPSLADDPLLSAHPHSARLTLWRGDITTLAADAIVNAANSQMLGCFRPGHRCIDNAIHSRAGPALRADCARIMQLQQHDEPAGHAKITRAHHLVSSYVLHTVGPSIHGPLTTRHERLLASSYRSCLDLAAQVGGISTIAFCSISTGVFGYPVAPAARTAIDTVTSWLDHHPDFDGRIIFDVFSSDDEAVYREALAATTPQEHR